LGYTIVSNLIITYTTPEAYCEGNLSDNPQPWDHLPLFQVDDPDDEDFELLVVGVGFMPLALPELLKNKFNETEVKLLFPFPLVYQPIKDRGNSYIKSAKIHVLM